MFVSWYKRCSERFGKICDSTPSSGSSSVENLFLFSKPCLDFCPYEVCPIVAFLESTMSSRSGCVCSWRVVPGKKSPLFTKTPRSKWYLFLNLSASFLSCYVWLLGAFLLELQQGLTRMWRVLQPILLLSVLVLVVFFSNFLWVVFSLY